jgi:hypothetical protein
MPNIDIPISDELKKLFEMPKCVDISLPKPSPIKITLPTGGGSLNAIADISKGIPTDCSMSFTLMLQLAPFLASIECLIRVLKLLKPLIDVIKGLPFPPVEAISDFIKAAGELAECFNIFANIPFFIKDVLCLILKILNCLVGQLKTVVGLMSGLSLQIQTAQSAGNTELLASLQCAQENAATSAAHLTQAIEPVGALLELVGPLMEIAGAPAIKFPAIGSAADVEGLNQVITALEAVMQVIGTAAEALPPPGPC